MIIFTIIALCCFLLFYKSTETSKQLDLNICKKYQTKAVLDFNNKNAKYYHFGMIPPKGELLKKLQKNNIEIIIQDNIIIPELSCYNEVILSKIN